MLLMSLQNNVNIYKKYLPEGIIVDKWFRFNKDNRPKSGDFLFINIGEEDFNWKVDYHDYETWWYNPNKIKCNSRKL